MRCAVVLTDLVFITDVRIMQMIEDQIHFNMVSDERVERMAVPNDLSKF